MSQPCLGALPPKRKPSFSVPAGACDCHTHIFGPYDRFPLAPERNYTPPEAPLENYIAHLDGLGFDRGVVVTASACGFDNSSTLDALRRYPQRLRGVAVLKPDVSERELDEMTEAGFRGLRLNLSKERAGHAKYANAAGLDTLAALGPKLKARGWHLQLWMNAADLPEVLPAVESHGMDLVMDHMGMPMRNQKDLNMAGFELLCGLVREGRMWVKISGADRLDGGDAPWRAADRFGRALVQANPERCVWASDWPHVGYFDRAMSEDAALADRLADWAPDAATRHRILVDNPARLYGF